MTLFNIVLKSAWHRRTSLLLTICSIAISVCLLFGVDKLRKETKNSFINTISQTDLIVGARSGPINLLLYSVFRIGNATNNVSWDSYEHITNFSEVAWAIPISLGDSHRGYRVMGTNASYFQHYKYGQAQPLAFDEGQPFADVYDAVVGADVARSLNYGLSDEIIISHGLASTKFSDHENKPFTIVGILAKTGTPVDRTVHIPLEGIEAVHVDWRGEGQLPLQLTAKQKHTINLEPETITAFMIGLNNRINTFRLQRKITEFTKEPLLAIIPEPRWQISGKVSPFLSRSYSNFRLRLSSGPNGHVNNFAVDPKRAPSRNGGPAVHWRPSIPYRFALCIRNAIRRLYWVHRWRWPILHALIPSTAVARRNLRYSRRNLPTRPIAMDSLCDGYFTGITR